MGGSFMNTEEVLISVIIPTYKRSDYICRAIDSVLSQKGSFEVIVVDDNDSQSEYRKNNELILTKYATIKNFKYLKHSKNLNGAAARNTGIKNSRGKYITFLDDDDEFCKERIEKVSKVLVETNCDFLYTGIILKKNGYVQKRIQPLRETNNKELIYKLLCIESFFGTGSNLICKKSIIEKINGFDEGFIRNQDIEFAIRYLNECENIKYIDEELVIKNTDSSTNMPRFEKMRQVKEKLLEKFKYIIDDYPDYKKKRVICRNLYEVYAYTTINGTSFERKEAIKLLKKHEVFSRRKVFKIFIKNKLKKFKIVVFIRKIISK